MRIRHFTLKFQKLTEETYMEMVNLIHPKNRIMHAMNET